MEEIFRRKAMREEIKQYIVDAHKRGDTPVSIDAFIRRYYGETVKPREIYDVFAEIDAVGIGMRCVCGHIGDDFTQLYFATEPQDSTDHNHDVALWEQEVKKAEMTSVFVCPVCGTLKVAL
jgi:rubrerythrin